MDDTTTKELKDNKLSWIFIREVNTVPAEINQLLLPGETPKAAYATIRDTAVFTDKRLIICDIQGITGTKREIYSIAYKSIIMWSTENSGILDLDSEVQIWTQIGELKIKLKKGIDVRKFDKLIASKVLD